MQFSGEWLHMQIHYGVWRVKRIGRRNQHGMHLQIVNDLIMQELLPYTLCHRRRSSSSGSSCGCTRDLWPRCHRTESRNGNGFQLHTWPMPKSLASFLPLPELNQRVYLTALTVQSSPVNGVWCSATNTTNHCVVTHFKLYSAMDWYRS